MCIQCAFNRSGSFLGQKYGKEVNRIVSYLSKIDNDKLIHCIRSDQPITFKDDDGAIEVLPEEQKSQGSNIPVLRGPPVELPNTSANSVIAAQKEFGNAAVQEQKRISAYNVED